MRLFIAVPVPDMIKKKVAQLGSGIEQEGVVLVRPDNMHLTLKFLGEIEQADGVKKMLENVKTKKFECIVSGVGVFPNENYVRVVWAGVKSDNELEKLAKKIDDSLLNFKELPKNEQFSAHLTIARVKKKLDVGDFLLKHKNEEYGRFQVEKFELIQSILGPSGPKYITLATFKLG